MVDPVSSKLFVFLITTIVMVVQMHFPDSSPADKHSANLWIFMACLFLYAFSFAYCKSQDTTSKNDSPSFKLSSRIAVISGSMACAALISVLVSKTGLALIIIIYFVCLLIYFAPNPATEICKKIGSYMHQMWNGVEDNHDPRANLQV